MRTAIIVVAAGRGTRLGGATAKAFVGLGTLPMLVYSLRTLMRLPSATSITLVVPPDGNAAAAEIIKRHGPWTMPVHRTPGGAERQDSVAAGLAIVDADADLVLVHDAARPFVSLACARACVVAAARHGAAIAALAAHDTVKLANAAADVTETLDRQRIWLAQTPQVFRTQLLRTAYTRARDESFVGTDDASLVERLGEPVHLVPGDPANRKITTPDDLEWAEWYLRTHGPPSTS